MTETEIWTDDAHEAIVLELRRVTLGGRGPRRSELRTDVYGRIYHAWEAYKVAVAASLRPTLSAAITAISRSMA